MRAGRALFAGILALGMVTPALAAPVLKATVGHMCCGNCERNVQSNVKAVAWVGDAQATRADRTVTVTPKPGMEVDAMALYNALYTGGFPATAFEITGASELKMDVGHVCCGNCATSVKAVLAKVNWIESAEVKPNAPVTLKVKSGMTVNVADLLAALVPAGFSVSHLVVTG